MVRKCKDLSDVERAYFHKDNISMDAPWSVVNNCVMLNNVLHRTPPSTQHQTFVAPTNVEIIGSYAFQCNKGTIYLPNVKRISADAFFKTTSIIYAPNVEVVEDNAFVGDGFCGNVFLFAPRLQKLSPKAFYHCEGFVFVGQNTNLHSNPKMHLTTSLEVWNSLINPIPA